jgi:hypothetical protein
MNLAQLTLSMNLAQLYLDFSKKAEVVFKK